MLRVTTILGLKSNIDVSKLLYNYQHSQTWKKTSYDSAVQLIAQTYLNIVGKILGEGWESFIDYIFIMICSLVVQFYDFSSILSSSENTEQQSLNWSDRLKIALGSARGLAYLHHECCPKIVHRDIKSSNILLDENMEPHVSDFGLAKLLVDEEAHVTTVVAGTFGYLAPGMSSVVLVSKRRPRYPFGIKSPHYFQTCRFQVTSPHRNMLNGVAVRYV